MQIIIIAILILINAYFAMTEISFISLKDAKIAKMAKDGDKRAKRIEKMLSSPSKFLATIQIGITFAGFFSSAFAGDAFASDLAPILYEFTGVLSLETWNTISLFLITMILSYFSLVFGELVPKRIGMKYAEQIAFTTATIIRWISIIFAPFVRLLTWSTNIVSKLFGVTESEEETVTEEEIRMMVDVGGEKGVIENQEKEFINNVFEFNNRIVSEIMIPRTEVFAVEEDTTLGELADVEDFDYRYSRIPVYEDTIDNIKGLIYMKDILRESKNKKTKVKALLRDAYYVPETKVVSDLFKELQKAKLQIAVVLDEYGGTAGIVTMEDILEEIVGDIYDEYDEVEEEYKKIDDTTFMLDGCMTIYEVSKVLDVTIPEGDYDTLSGFILEELGRIPKTKEKVKVETDEVLFTVEKVEDRRIALVKAVKKEKIEVQDEDEEDVKEPKKSNRSSKNTRTSKEQETKEDEE